MNSKVNTKIYKRVHSLAKELMHAAQRKNQSSFDKSYGELEQLCRDNENSEKDHPVQWETLADFTDDLTLAISIYQKALVKAETINGKDYLSSIGFSLGSLNAELGEVTSAIEYLEAAKVHSNKIPDKELKAEIVDLLEGLSNA